MIMILLFNLLFRSMSSFRRVRRTTVQMPMLRGSRGGIFSISETPDPDAVSRVHIDLARQPYFCLETDFMPAFQLIMRSHKDVSLMQFQVNACLFTTQQNNLSHALLLGML